MTPPGIRNTGCLSGNAKRDRRGKFLYMFCVKVNACLPVRVSKEGGQCAQVSSPTANSSKCFPVANG